VIKTVLGIALATLIWSSTAALADCNQPTPDPVTHVPVPGHPFSAIPTADGCNIFVSLTDAKASHLLVLKRDNGIVTVLHNLAALGQLTGMALSPDGHFLAAANGAGVTLFQTDKLISGDEKPMGYLNDRSGAGSIYAGFSPDQHLLFVSDENNQSITVYDFKGLFMGKGANPVGEIHTGAAPVGLAFSLDGKLLYSTSEVASSTGACSEGGGRTHGPGILMVIDVAKAAIAPSDAVLARADAGCSPVRVTLSADSTRAYVTARGQNQLLVFDTAKLQAGGAALVAQIPVGTSPVGVAAAKDNIFITNSNRFGGSANQSISVVDAQNLSAPQTNIPAGGFPRELKLTADGNALLVTNFASGSVEFVDLARLAQAQH
jgi:DNA-binding beta-propeller fold protein YncE